MEESFYLRSTSCVALTLPPTGGAKFLWAPVFFLVGDLYTL